MLTTWNALEAEKIHFDLCVECAYLDASPFTPRPEHSPARYTFWRYF